jgi:hypothetical protein
VSPPLFSGARIVHDVESPPLAHLAGVRLSVVLWGGLAVVDLWRLTGTTSYVALGALALLVALCSIGMPPGTCVTAGVVGWLLANGFVVHHLGVLRYDGLPDVARLVLLVGVAVLSRRVHR